MLEEKKRRRKLLAPACEGIFKSFARALRQAAAKDPREKGIPSSKGKI